MVTQVTPPLSAPVSLSEIKDHLRIIGTGEDTYLSVLLNAATAAAEEITRRQLEPATYDLHLDAFPRGAIEVPRPPLQSVESVTYVDTDGATQTFTDFTTDTVKGRLVPAYGFTWPATRAVPNAVKVRFVAGYSAGQTPFPIRSAILLLVAGLYENRESNTPHKLYENETVERLLWPYRVFR
jgi:uncharacterized phiE125 gp8 family phage protein